MPGRRAGRRAARSTGRRAARRTSRRTFRRRRRRRRRILVGGAILIGGGALVYKLSKQDAQKIEEYTGVPPEELEDEDLQAAMADLNIQSQDMTAEDQAALAQDQAANPEPAAPSGGQDDMIEQLKQLAALKDAGILTEEEFEAKKKQILGL